MHNDRRLINRGNCIRLPQWSAIISVITQGLIYKASGLVGGENNQEILVIFSWQMQKVTINIDQSVIQDCVTANQYPDLAFLFQEGEGRGGSIGHVGARRVNKWVSQQDQQVFQSAIPDMSRSSKSFGFLLQLWLCFIYLCQTSGKGRRAHRLSVCR